MSDGVVIAICFAASGLLVGFALGTILERKSWVDHARAGRNVAHHCGGAKYCVMEERQFLHDYVRREHATPRLADFIRETTPHARLARTGVAK